MCSINKIAQYMVVCGISIIIIMYNKLLLPLLCSSTVYCIIDGSYYI